MCIIIKGIKIMNCFVKIPSNSGMTKDYYKNFNTGLLNCLSNILVEGKLLAEDRIAFLDKLTDPAEKAFANAAVAQMENAQRNNIRVRKNLAYFGAMLKDSDKVALKGSSLTNSLWHTGEMLNWPEIIQTLSNPLYNIKDDAELLNQFEKKIEIANQYAKQYGDNPVK